MMVRRTLPRMRKKEPRSKVGFIRAVCVIMKPVENPAVMLKRNGGIRRVPETVAVSRRTAWNWMMLVPC
jgi:hypothetical protein